MHNVKDAQVVLYNAFGQIVYTNKSINTSIFSVDVSQLAKGIYNIVIIANNKQQVEKVLIQ